MLRLPKQIIDKIENEGEQNDYQETTIGREVVWRSLIILPWKKKSVTGHYGEIKSYLESESV